jgi:hypothetical protein
MTLGFALAVITYWPVFTWLGTFKDNPVVLTILVFYMVILVTMVYGPIAAFLVELFPARIRYTSMSLPYHVGNGVFGGLVPAAGASVAAITGIALSGLLYPMAIAAIGVVVSLAFIREPTHGIRIWDEVGGGGPPLAQLRRFEHFRTPKWLRLLRPTPKGRHYSGIGGTGPAVILGGGWAGRSSFSFVSKRLRSGSGSV